MGLFLNYERIVADGELDTFRANVRRRAAREPVAYITGEKEFFGLPFSVTNDVLIPRPETELLVEGIALRAKKRDTTRSLRILDIGTGSGAIAVAVAHELAATDTVIVATDLSEAALRVARSNAERNGVAARIVFRHGDLLQAVQTDETFFAVLSNLPYIPTSAFLTLEPEVAAFEPRLALDGGDDGLNLIRSLVARAPSFIERGGWLALEMGTGQAEAVVESVRATSAFDEATVERDYAGIERLVFARKR